MKLLLFALLTSIALAQPQELPPREVVLMSACAYLAAHAQQKFNFPDPASLWCNLEESDGDERVQLFFESQPLNGWWLAMPKAIRKGRGINPGPFFTLGTSL